MTCMYSWMIHISTGVSLSRKKNQFSSFFGSCSKIILGSPTSTEIPFWFCVPGLVPSWTLKWPCNKNARPKAFRTTTCRSHLALRSNSIVFCPGHVFFCFVFVGWMYVLKIVEPHKMTRSKSYVLMTNNPNQEISVHEWMLSNAFGCNGQFRLGKQKTHLTWTWPMWWWISPHHHKHCRYTQSVKFPP